MLKLRRVSKGRLGVRLSTPRLRRTSPSALKLRRVNKVVMVRQAHHEGGQVLLRGSTMFRHGSFHEFYVYKVEEMEGDFVDLDSSLRWNDIVDAVFKRGEEGVILPPVRPFGFAQGKLLRRREADLLRRE